MRSTELCLAAGSGLLAAALAAGCASSGGASGGTSAAPASTTARATIEARSGSQVSGTATFTEASGGVRVVVEVSGATPGEHAVHLHEKGDCSAPDATSAGGHFNPYDHPHAGPTADRRHAGDFGNMTVGADGKGRIDLTTDRLTIGPGPSSVVGKGIIVHTQADDLTTQPTGNAGGRIGCGVVK